MLKIGADNAGLKASLKESKSDIKAAFSVDPVHEFTQALTGTTSSIESLIGKATGFAAVAAGGFGFVSLIDGAVKAGNSAYELSQRLQISAGDAVQLSRVLSLSGTDVGSFNSGIMRLDKNLYAAGDSGKLCRDTLAATGVTLTDANGKLLPLNQQLANMAQGYDKAKASGQQQLFLMNTLGVKGLQLASVFENYNEKVQIASGTKGIGLNPEEMHKMSLELESVKMQANQLKLVFGSALVPIAQEFFPPILEGMKETATYLAAHKEGVTAIVIEVAKLIAVTKAINTGKSLANWVGTAGKSVFSGSGSAEIAEAEKTSALRQKAYDQAVRASEAGYMRQINAATRSALAESESAEEAAVKIAAATERITAEAEVASAKIRESFTAGFSGAAAAAEESAVAINTAMQSTGTVAAETSAAKTAAVTESATVCQAVVAESSAAQIAAMNATAEAAATTAATKTAVTVESAEACSVAIAASCAEQEASIAEVGIVAEETCAKQVTANETAAASAQEVIAAQTLVAEAEVVAGNTAIESGVKMEVASQAAATEVGILAGVVKTLQANWILVAYATYEALSYLWKYQQELSKNPNLDVSYNSDGQPIYTKHNSMATYKQGEDTNTLPPVQTFEVNKPTIPELNLPTAMDYGKTPHEPKGKTDHTLEKEEKKAQEINDKIRKEYQELFYSKEQLAEAEYDKERQELEKTKDVNTAYYDYIDTQGNRQLGAKSQLEAILLAKKKVATEKQAEIEQGYTDNAIALAKKLADVKAEAVGGSVEAQAKQDEADKAALKAISDEMRKVRNEINETTNLQDRLKKIDAGKKAGYITGDTSSGYVTKENTQAAEDAALAAQTAVNKQKDIDSAYDIWKKDLDKEYSHGHVQQYQQMLNDKQNLDRKYLTSQQAYMSETESLWGKANHTIYDDASLTMSNLSNDMEGVFTKFAHGTAGAMDVVHTFTQSLIDSMIKIQAQAAAANLTQGMGSLFGISLGGTGSSGATATAHISQNAINTALPTSFAFAEGGLLSGPGTTISDRILMLGSPGEYMVNAASTNSVGVETLEYINKTGKLPGYATGGLITGRSLSSMSSARGYSDSGSSAQSSGSGGRSGITGIEVVINNNGQPVKEANVSDNGIINGVRQLIIELAPDATLSKAANNRVYANNFRSVLG